MNYYFDFGKYQFELEKRIKDALCKKNEFEIRFGEFKVNRDLNGVIQRDANGRVKRSFDSNFEAESFYDLKKLLNKQNINKSVLNTKEIIYRMDSGFNAKEIIDLSDGSCTYMKKKRLYNYDVYDYNMRFSTSNEQEITKDEYDLQKQNGGEINEIKREKFRTSYYFPSGKIDLTVTHQTLSNDIITEKKTRNYEVEFEIYNQNNDNDNENVDMNSIVGIILFILQNKQGSFFIITENEKRNVLDVYKKMIGKSYFVGAQPETLAKDKISNFCER